MAIAPIQNAGGTTPAAASRPAKPAEPAAPAAAPLPGQPRPEQVQDAVQTAAAGRGAGGTKLAILGR
ncbi:hypothetical protein MASR1M97_31700 [Candidatus Desulfobacillus denitrificans]